MAPPCHTAMSVRAPLARSLLTETGSSGASPSSTSSSKSSKSSNSSTVRRSAPLVWPSPVSPSPSRRRPSGRRPSRRRPSRRRPSRRPRGGSGLSDALGERHADGRGDTDGEDHDERSDPVADEEIGVARIGEDDRPNAYLFGCPGVALTALELLLQGVGGEVHGVDGDGLVGGGRPHDDDRGPVVGQPLVVGRHPPDRPSSERPGRSSPGSSRRRAPTLTNRSSGTGWSPRRAARRRWARRAGHCLRRDRTGRRSSRTTTVTMSADPTTYQRRDEAQGYEESTL